MKIQGKRRKTDSIRPQRRPSGSSVQQALNLFGICQTLPGISMDPGELLSVRPPDAARISPEGPGVFAGPACDHTETASIEMLSGLSVNISIEALIFGDETLV